MASLASVCSSYASSLSGVAPFRQELTEGQVKAVQTAVDLLGPVCRSAAKQDDVGPEVLNAAIDALQGLLLVKQSVGG